MVELERSLVPKLSNYIKFWKRFVDNTITFANTETIEIAFYCIEQLILTFNSPMKQENSKLPFLDVILCHKDNKLVCSIYRKSTNNDIYMN